MSTAWRVVAIAGGALGVLFVAEDLAERKFHLAAMSAAGVLCYVYALHFADKPRAVRLRPRVVVPVAVLAVLTLALSVWPS